VDVIAHEAVACDAQPRAAAVAAQDAELESAVGVVEEDCLPEIAALRNMMPAARSHHASDSAHVEIFGWLGGKA